MEVAAKCDQSFDCIARLITVVESSTWNVDCMERDPSLFHDLSKTRNFLICFVQITCQCQTTKHKTNL
jgi:hypothetical protein